MAQYQDGRLYRTSSKKTTNFINYKTAPTMARPIKTGLDYFSFDVDTFEDEKMQALSGEFGIKGEITVVKLLCAIYRNGYYAEWNDLLKYKLLRTLPTVSAELLEQIVSRLVKWGFFNEELFSSTGVLSSSSIQQRYFAATKRRISAYNLRYILVSVNNNPVNVDKNPVNVDKNTIKESKVNKEKREKENARHFLPPSISDVREFIKQSGYTSVDATTFISFYESKGWKVGGTYMRNWQAAVTTWETRNRAKDAPKKQAAAQAEEMREQKRIEAERRREEAKRNHVTREEYLETKRRAAAGDPVAISKLLPPK